MTDRLFPDGIGEVLHTLLHPESQSEPPHTHAFSLPPSEEFLADLANPIRLEPRATPIRDGGRHGG